LAEGDLGTAEVDVFLEQLLSADKLGVEIQSLGCP
jgi:hypothetical protein